MQTAPATYNVSNWSHQWARVLRKEYAGLPGIGVGNGLSGIALFFLYRYAQHEKQEDLRFVGQLLETIVAKLLTGVHDHPMIIDLTEFLQLLDITESLAPGHFDTAGLKEDLTPVVRELGEGLLKKGHYDPYLGGFFPAYHLLHSSTDTTLTEKCIDILVDQTQYVSRDEGFFHSGFDKERVCLSITHGLAFYITFLCAAYSKGIKRAECLQLLSPYSNYLFGSRQPFDKYNCFFTDYERERSGSRLNLCYGDAGILLSLLKAARILRNTALEQSVLGMLERTADRMDPASTGVRDNSLLYGSAGLSLYYQKIYQLTGSPQFAQASRRWWKTCLADTEHRMKPYTLSERAPAARIAKDISFQEGLTGVLTLSGYQHGAPLDHLQFFFYLQ